MTEMSMLVTLKKKYVCKKKLRNLETLFSLRSIFLTNKIKFYYKMTQFSNITNSETRKT